MLRVFPQFSDWPRKPDAARRSNSRSICISYFLQQKSNESYNLIVRNRILILIFIQFFIEKKYNWNFTLFLAFY